jgi:alpha-glucosidase (family GH31 glycosyl hydrolase)
MTTRELPGNTVETGIWNDMNEPAVFDVVKKTKARDNLHYGRKSVERDHESRFKCNFKGQFGYF